MGSPAQSLRCVCFGEFALDPRTGELRVNGQISYLQDKPLQVLVLLLEHPGELVTRDELMKRLWSADTFVDFDQSLNKAVNRLREALEDSSEHPRFIETVPRRGYRFIAPVTIENHRESATAFLSGSSPAARVREWPTNPVRTDSEPAGWRNWKVLTGAVVLALAVIGAVGFGVMRRSSRNRSFNLEKMEITKLTRSGKVESVAISPDGRFCGLRAARCSGTRPLDTASSNSH